MEAHEPENEAWAQNWGILLRTARQVAGLSLTELSSRTGLSKGYLSKLESGHLNARNPSRATLAALARALPGFSALAQMLEPALPSRARLTRDHDDAVLPPLDATRFSSDTRPLALGWRELEVLIALLTLERAAVPVSPTAIVLARITGRTPGAVRPILDDLVAAGLLVQRPPFRPGAHPSYMRAPDFAARTGLDRPGDALILAAALLNSAPNRFGSPKPQSAQE